MFHPFTGVTTLANTIPDIGTLTKFDISKCELMAEGGKALAAGLKGNQGITELNISANFLGWNLDESADNSCIIAIVDAIPDMRALTSLHVGQNYILEKEMREIIAIAMRMERQYEDPLRSPIQGQDPHRA
jgi:hypothetical protein